MRLLIMGPQGVGKGTQAKLLAEHYGIPTISTGDIFRANIKNKTELGKKVLEYTSQGFLVPDELTNEIVRDRLAQGKRARHRGIARPALVDGAMRRRADVFGRIKIRLAGAETDHVLALGLQRLGARVDGQGRGRGDLRRSA